MTVKNVLVFPCGSEIGLEIYRSIAHCKHLRLFGASSIDDHGRFIYRRYIGNLPFVDSTEFTQSINSVLQKNQIEFIFPAHDSAVLLFSKLGDRLHSKVIGSPYKTVNVCRHKQNTYTRFKQIIPVPNLFKNLRDVRIFPVFLKPDVGQGSKRTYLVNNPEELKFLTDRESDLLIMEYLPGPEYTVDCFTDRHGKLRFVGARLRKRVLNGISVNTLPVGNDRFSEIASKINSNLVFRGAWFFQVKENVQNDLVLLEIAPRIAGSMALYRNLGINFALLSYYDALGMDVELRQNHYSIELDRALSNRFRVDIRYNHVYIDLDDCLIINDRVNPLLMAFIFQCLNNKIKMHLLTRHRSTINETLARFRMTQLFDSIIQIDNRSPKSGYITHRDAILIDDSFAERCEVQINTGIPVFDLDAVECLIDL